MRDLRGRRVVVTAGGTREAIDPVRYIGNRSSGKMGNALAHAAASAGGDVTLITAAPPPPPEAAVTVVAVETSDEMHERVRAALTPGTVLIMAAAVADYRPAHPAAHKIKKAASVMTLELVPTVDILRSIAEDPIRDDLFVVGFAAETDDAVDGGRAKVRAKRLDLCVVNDVSAPGIGMGADDNAVTILDSGGIVEDIPRAPKGRVAERIVDLIIERLSR